MALFLSCHCLLLQLGHSSSKKKKKKEDPDAKMFLYFVSNDSEAGKKPHDTSDIMHISHMIYDAYR